MSIENLLERIAVALETIAKNGTGLVSTHTPASPAENSQSSQLAAEPSESTETTTQEGVNPFDDTTLELDKENHYWQADIHATTKSKVGGGVWRLKKGIDKELVEQKLGKQDYWFKLLEGDDGKSNVQESLGDDKTNSSTAPPPPPPEIISDDSNKVMENTERTIRIPEHGDAAQLNRDEWLLMSNDFLEIHGEKGQELYAEWCNEGNREGWSVDKMDEAGMRYVGWKLLEYLTDV